MFKGWFKFFNKTPKIDKQHTWPENAATIVIFVDRPISGLKPGRYVLSRVSFTGNDVFYTPALSNTLLSVEELKRHLEQKKIRVISHSEGYLKRMKVKG